MSKKILAIFLAVMMLVALTVPAAAYEPPELIATADPLGIGDAAVTEFTVKLDGKDLKITAYEDEYVKNPTAVAGDKGFAKDGTNYVDQGISIYVPETATADSPVYFIVNNSGWQSDNYASRTQIYPAGTMVQSRQGEYDGGAFDSASSNVGAALARGMVVVSYGCRGRNDAPDADGKYVSHSPATMTDTKAALRYLRYNAEALGVGDMDKILVTGTSGGGALSVVIAASGNSADYYPSLYEIGAAGMTDAATSTISDAVFATVAYCPINDLREADQAYEWTFNAARKTLVADGAAYGTWKMGDTDVTEQVLAASDVLAAAYPVYVESLNIGLTADNMEQAMVDLLNAEIADTLAEGATYESMKADVEKFGDSSWFVKTDDGAKIGDLQTYLVWLCNKQQLKAAPAFSNLGMNIAMQNEDSLLGTEAYPYCAYEFYSWDNDAAADNGCGKDDTGLTWDEFMATDAGAALALQNKMASPIDYLTSDAANVDTAAYWYVRHGMADRDTSFALQTTLYYAMKSNAAIKDLNFEFAWLQGHGGNYDVPEAFAWIDQVLGTAVIPVVSEEPVPEKAPEVVLSSQKLTVDGEAVEVQAYNIDGYNYLKLRDMAALLIGSGAPIGVAFDAETNTANVTKGGVYEKGANDLVAGEDNSATCVASAQTILVDGVAVEAQVYNIGGYNYFKLRDLGTALGFGVDYDAASNTGLVTTK